jgi:hypothetical protein
VCGTNGCTPQQDSFVLGRGERDCVEGGDLGSASGQRTSGFKHIGKTTEEVSSAGPLQGRQRNLSCSSFLFLFHEDNSHFKNNNIAQQFYARKIEMVG